MVNIEDEKERMKEENEFINSLLTPITLISGFLLAVTFYLVDLEIGAQAAFPMAFEISVFVIFFCVSLISLNFTVSARIANRIQYERILSKGISKSEIFTLFGFIAFILTTLGVSYLVPVMAYGLMGFVSQGQSIALFSLIANTLVYVITLGLAFLPSKK